MKEYKFKSVFFMCIRHIADYSGSAFQDIYNLLLLKNYDCELKSYFLPCCIILHTLDVL